MQRIVTVETGQFKISCIFPGSPVIKNLPSNAGVAGSIPGRGTKIPHAVGQRSPCSFVMQLRLDAAKMIINKYLKVKNLNIIFSYHIFPKVSMLQNRKNLIFCQITQ